MACDPTCFKNSFSAFLAQACHGYPALSLARVGIHSELKPHSPFPGKHSKRSLKRKKTPQKIPAT